MSEIQAKRSTDFIDDYLGQPLQEHFYGVRHSIPRSSFRYLLHFDFCALQLKLCGDWLA